LHDDGAAVDVAVRHRGGGGDGLGRRAVALGDLRREYAIPCVVATQVATHMIPDGATITVDGAAGTVRIEG
jgi:phosphohistidine swiveling domain-containing protein